MPGGVRNTRRFASTTKMQASHLYYKRPMQSSAYQSKLSLVNQNVSNWGCANRSELAIFCVIGGRQFLQFLPARRGSEQSLQFFLPVLEGSLGNQWTPLSNTRGDAGI